MKGQAPPSPQSPACPPLPRGRGGAGCGSRLERRGHEGGVSCEAKPGPSGTSLFTAKTGRMTDSIKAPKPSRHLRSPRSCGWVLLAASLLPPVHHLPTGHSHSPNSSFSHMPSREGRGVSGAIHATQPRVCCRETTQCPSETLLQGWKPSEAQGQRPRVLCSGSRSGTGGPLLKACGRGTVDLELVDREVKLGWQLGARPGLTRFPAPSAPGRDSCPPGCQGQGGARVTHHSHGNRVGLVAFLMTQGG